MSVGLKSDKVFYVKSSFYFVGIKYIIKQAKVCISRTILV